MAEIQGRFLIVAFDWENFLKDRLQTGISPFGWRNVFLQKVDVGIKLNLDQVRRLNRLFNGPEVDTLCYSAV
jgi:hypothetical protein